VTKHDAPGKRKAFARDEIAGESSGVVAAVARQWATTATSHFACRNLAACEAVRNETAAARQRDVFGRLRKHLQGTQGMEFEEVREYQQGDDVRTIDWNVTARMGKPFVKKFRHERELRVFIVVDISPSLLFGTQGKLKSELAVEVAAALIFAAIRSNDRVGLLLFTDRVEKFIPPRKGIRHAHRLVRELLFTQPQGLGTDLAAALEFLRRITRRRRSIIFLLSDFHATNYESVLKKLAARHEVLALTLHDRRERSLAPCGVIRFVDLETGEERWIDLRSSRHAEQWQRFLESEWQRRRQLFTQLRIDYAEVIPGESPLLPLMELFRKRECRLKSGR